MRQILYKCTVWIVARFRNSNAQEWRRLQKAVDIVWSIRGTDLATVEGIYRMCFLKKAVNIIKDSNYWPHCLLTATITKSNRNQWIYICRIIYWVIWPTSSVPIVTAIYTHSMSYIPLLISYPSSCQVNFKLHNYICLQYLFWQRIPDNHYPLYGKAYPTDLL